MRIHGRRKSTNSWLDLSSGDVRCQGSGFARQKSGVNEAPEFALLPFSFCSRVVQIRTSQGSSGKYPKLHDGAQQLQAPIKYCSYHISIMQAAEKCSLVL
jgi:hypothetical protein